MVKLVDQGANLPDGSGVAVVTARGSGTVYYAVTTVSNDGSCVESGVTVGENALASGVPETVSAIEPIRQVPSTDVNQQPTIYGWGGDAPPAGMPVMLWLHASGGQANSTICLLYTSRCV